MVQAVLEGRKSQTRRVVKGKWPPLVEEVLRVNGKWVWDTLDYELTTPYGQLGDRLWVRETWKIIGLDHTPNNYRLEIQYKSDSKRRWFCVGKREFDKYSINPTSAWGADDKWRPSIFMPRWASRITLEIINIRVERVQDISEEDAMTEGATPILVDPDGGSCPHIEGYIKLWDSINAKRGYGWDTNPYVWVIEFKRVEQ